jgi:alanine-glyoxylate transaminase/serine-glyoxylate transaminase/serine-pyruvate transaminase
MKNALPVHSGRHFLQIPGPTNVPARVLQAMALPTIDHRGPEFAALAQEVVAGTRRVFQTDGMVAIYPSSGTGAWEAALVNTLSPGDRVLMFETGQFASLWRQMAARLGIDVELVPGDWRHGVDPALVEERLAADGEHRIKAVCVVHNETSTGITSRIGEIREAIDRTGHPALFLVDTVSSLGSIDYRHDEWRVDVTVAGSQKGLMLPPGLGFNAVSKKALAAAKTARMPRSYWDWAAMEDTGTTGFFPYTPATNLLFGARLPTPRAARRGDAARVRPLGPRIAMPRPARALEHADRDPPAAGVRCRPAAPGHPRRLRHVARHRARAPQG